MARLSIPERRDLPAPVRALYQRLRPIVSEERRRELNQGLKIRGEREYCHNELRYSVPDGVFSPSSTSKIIYSSIEKKRVDLEGQSVLFVGIGAGVEAVLAAQQGAREIWGMDIHEPSATASRDNFARHIGAEGPPAHFLASDLLQSLPERVEADFIFFNAPTVSLKVEDSELERVACSGSEIFVRFFEELQEKQALKRNGRLIMPMSNTSDLKGCMSYAIRQGFVPSLVFKWAWSGDYDDLTSYVFSFSSSSEKG